MSLSDLPIIALGKIIKSLDRESCEHFVKAVEKSELEDNLKLLQRSKLYMCPYCVQESEQNYMCEVYERQNEILSSKSNKVKQSDYFIEAMKTFNPFIGVRVNDQGLNNYERVQDEKNSSKYLLRNRFNDIEDYESIPFSMNQSSIRSRWSSDLIELLKKIETEEDLRDILKSNVSKAFFGGDTCFGFIPNLLKTFRKEELIEHIDDEHFSARVHNAKIKSKNKWYTKLYQSGPIDVPKQMFFGEEMLDLQDFREWLMDMVVARYLMKDKNETQLQVHNFLSERDYMWFEISKIYKLIKTTFNDARYPFKPHFSCKDINFYKVTDIVSLVLEKLA